ncbi:15218_t:CDS:2, partial [Gigaspora margarita]
MDRLKRFISEQELKMTTIFPLIRGTFSLNVIDDKCSVLATNEARNESNNPFQRAKVGHKADMKEYCRKKKYLNKVKLSIMMRDSINKALKQWKHISDENRKSLVLYGFTQDGLEINFYAMSWFEGIYLFGRIDSCMVPSEEDN